MVLSLISLILIRPPVTPYVLEGIHARPAGELVKAAKQFTSTIKLAKDGKSGDCKKIFGIMGLAVKNGQEVTLTFEGEDEEAAYEAVSQFMKENM